MRTLRRTALLVVGVALIAFSTELEWWSALIGVLLLYFYVSDEVEP